MIFRSLKNACTFLLVKEKTWKPIFNTNSELSQNRTEKQIIPCKITVHWLFNDTWCYLFIACFDWKIGVFQQTVVRVNYIPKGPLLGTYSQRILIHIFLVRPDAYTRVNSNPRGLSTFIVNNTQASWNVIMAKYDITLCAINNTNTFARM